MSVASMTRRGFLGGTGAAIATTALGSKLAFASPQDPSAGDVIVLVSLTGGADGLSLVAPYQMPTYKALRPNIRVKGASEVSDPSRAGLVLRSGGSVAPFDLSGVFALHPSLAPLYDTAWADGRLAFVHAVGMPASESATRSHFESINYWESGSASLNVTTGFMNRFLESVGATAGISGIGRAASLPRSLTGAVPTFSMPAIGAFGVSGYPDNAKAAATLAGWYEDAADPLERTGRDTLLAANTIKSVNWSGAALAPKNGAVYPWSGFAQSLREVAQLIRANVGLRVACVELFGWDSHDAMGSPEDPSAAFSEQCSVFAEALAAFYRDLGSLNSEVTVATITEFGRTIDENGSGGTDHGRASAMMVMGGGAVGGVHGPFVDSITNGPEDDLTVLTDYRQVLSEVLTVRGGSASTSSIFPTWTPAAPIGVCKAIAT